MTISQVFYTSRASAESLAATPHMAVISITDPRTPPAKLDPRFNEVLRLSFFDAEPADEYLPSPIAGMFDHVMARQIGNFVQKLHATPGHISVMVHCEYGVSRSAAVALFVAAYADAPLAAREFAYAANPWVVDRLAQLFPDLILEIPPEDSASERRVLPRAA